MDKDSALEEIKFIKNIITDSRRSFVENGKGFIVWGILVFVGLVITYISVKLKFSINYIWVILIALGWIYSTVSNIRARKKRRTITFNQKILNAVWISAGISMTLVGFIPTYLGIFDPVYINPMLSVILGMAFFVSGFLYSYKKITYLAFGWWLGAIYMFIFPTLETLLIMSGMILLFQIVPGILFYINAKNN